MSQMPWSRANRRKRRALDIDGRGGAAVIVAPHSQPKWRGRLARGFAGRRSFRIWQGGVTNRKPHQPLRQDRVDPSTWFANALPILDCRHRIVKMLQDVTGINIIKLIVLECLHCSGIAHILIVMDAIGQADGIRSIVCINPATADVNALALDVFPIEAFLDSAFMRLPGLCHE